MRTGFNRAVYGDGGRTFPVSVFDGLTSQLDPKPDAILVFNPADTDVVVAVTYSKDGLAFGSPVNTTIKAGAFSEISLNGATAYNMANIAVTTAGGRVFFSFVNYAQGNGLA